MFILVRGIQCPRVTTAVVHVPRSGGRTQAAIRVHLTEDVLILTPNRPATVRSPYEVTGYDPPARLAGHGVAGPVRFQEEYRLTGDGAATILTQSIRATAAAHSGLVPGLLRRQLKKLIASDLGRLKDLVEAETPHS